MENDGDAVARELDVELPCLGTRFPPQHGRFQRVLRGMNGITPMGEHQGKPVPRSQKVEKQALHDRPSTQDSW
jgi:hypothetical protein